MKVHLELNMPDERMFLNFWNSINGDDAVCEIKGDKLFLSQYDENGHEIPSKEITIQEFCDIVKLKHVVLNEIHGNTKTELTQIEKEELHEAIRKRMKFIEFKIDQYLEVIKVNPKGIANANYWIQWISSWNRELIFLKEMINKDVNYKL